MKENPHREERESIRELLKQFENLIKGQGSAFIEEESFEKIIEHFQGKEDMTKAMEAARLGCDQFPYSALLLIKKADILLSNRRYKDALEVLDQASLLDGRDINLYILKTDAYLALDQPAKAAVILENAISLFVGQERIELLFELADVYDDYEEFDKVFDCLKMVLTDEPNNEEALYKICFWTDFTGRNEESIRLHQQIIDEFPYNELAWFNLAAAFQGLKLYEKAVDAYQYAITIDEKFDYAYRNMGDAFIRLRKYKEAVEVLERVIELAKPESVIYEAIGHCYDRMKNYAQARFYYRKASHLQDEDSKLFYKIACTYFNEGQWSSCIKQLENALKIKRDQPEFNLLMGECKMQLQFHREAVQYFSNVIRMRPRNAGGWEAFLRCLYKAGLFEEALEKANMAYEMTNKKPVFLYYKTAILFGLNRSKEAILQLEEALQRAPKLLKKYVELNPAILQNQSVVDVIARFKRNKAI
ncbi:MAG TPA: tetratricopeptide repeat protein [Chitinophagaceae bacterium]|nr:tetratricopeptide repeat protein [Chitinophagaceae bacterium]